MASKKDFTVVITDSGIGGVGIAAELVRTLQERGPHVRANVVFFNALFDAKSGYNVLTDMDEKVRIFDTALQGMLRFKPDALLLGSNTLSVLFEKTSFSRTTSLPVTGLLDLGVQHILDQSGEDRSEVAVVLFATPLTVQEGVFRERLSPWFKSQQIVEHACTGLEHAIGDGDLPTIHRLIEHYVEQALRQVPLGTRRIFASLHCTHFGYYQQAFDSAMRRLCQADFKVLNPNAELAHFLVRGDASEVIGRNVDVRFVSKVHFHAEGVRSLMSYVNAISPEAGRAFANYEYVPDLF